MENAHKSEVNYRKSTWKMWKSYPQAFKHTNPAKYDKI
ncbi:hypothetical protein B4166_2356 [Caldibacillus thermoamylovorans]|uniref:Uncharacterized protein n=1 Tax=Caldibacillus thermoamylovorans TaxID=35841 RepID=A0ABD4A8I4_9BACI|nr:hypothetical protein B4166_2356 [Caldibacillus thermoamylovorans]KIO73263.1 hypothetical protein B4167_2276 [Caldibacillus thermoamylovorans]